MTIMRRTRTDRFEDGVRKLLNLRDGRLPLKGGSVLDNADIDDGKGGRVLIRMMGCPDGARVRGITYTVAAGTAPSAWRTLLIGKYRSPAQDSDSVDGKRLHVRWCGQAACLGEGGVFRLSVEVDVRGGTIALEQPDSTSQRLTELVEAYAAKLAARGKPAL